MKTDTCNKWIRFTVLFCLSYISVSAFQELFFDYPCLFAQSNAASANEIRMADSVAVTDMQIKAAVQLWQKNVEAIKSRDVKQQKKYWNKDEAEKGATYDRHFFSFKQYELFTKNCSDTIVRAFKIEDDCIQLSIQWQKMNLKNPSFVETIYVIRENKKRVLAHALTAMTRNWSKKETKHLTYHWYWDHRFNSKEAEAMDGLIQNLCHIFHLKLDHKIAYYIFPSKTDPPKFQQWGVSRSSLGEALNRSSIVVDWTNDSEAHPHEITHIVQRRLTEKLPCIFLLEGMATYFGGWNLPRETIFKKLKESLSRTSIPPVDSLILLSYQKGDLMQKEDLWVKCVGAAVVGYLFENFGAEAFKRFYIDASTDRNDRANSQSFVDSLKNAYQMSPSELDAKYRKWLMARAQ